MPWRSGGVALATIMDDSYPPSARVHPVSADSTLPRLVAHALPHLPDVMALHEPNGVYRLVSHQIRGMTGWRPSELIGHSPYEWIHPDDTDVMRRRYHDAILRGASVRGQLRFRHREGHYLWIDFTGVPIFENAQEPRTVSSIITFTRDVTSRVQAQEAAQERSSHLSLMQDMAGLAWFSIDFRGGTVKHNEAFVELTGQAASVLGGMQAWRRMVHPLDWAQVRQTLVDLRQSPLEESRTLELRLLASGRLRWVRVSLALVCQQGGHRIHRRQLYGVMLDIDELVRSRERTQRWIRERERAGSRERQEIAHELHDEVGQILTGLRWQLEAVRRAGGLAAARTTEATLPLDHWIDSLDDAHRTLRQIAHRLRPPLAALGLRAAILKLGEEFSHRWLGATQLDLQVEETLPDGDEWRVNVVLGILRECLNNVTRHAKADGVSVRASSPCDGLLRLTIRDDGVGMDLDAALAGNTLGLTSLRERARLIDARLIIDTAPGAGTRIALEAWMNGAQP